MMPNKKANLENKIEQMEQLIRSAGYAPHISISTAELPYNLAKQYGFDVASVTDERHTYIRCWNIVVLTSGYPLVAGGSYFATLDNGVVETEAQVRRFCYDYWKGEGKRPTKKQLGVV